QAETSRTREGEGCGRAGSIEPQAVARSSVYRDGESSTAESDRIGELQNVGRRNDLGCAAHGREAPGPAYEAVARYRARAERKTVTTHRECRILERRKHSGLE